MRDLELQEAFILQQKGMIFSCLSLQEGRIEKIILQAFGKYGQPAPYPGSMILYYNTKRIIGERIVIENIEIELCATQLAARNIYLLHQILEVCHFFIPPGTQACAIFYFLLELFKNKYDQCALSPLYTKIVLCKLFVLLGLYPEEISIQNFAYQIGHMHLDNLFAASLELKAEALMNKWLIWCKEMHPKGKFFKALPFLLEK